MTRLLLLLAVLPYFAFSGASLSYAQDETADEATEIQAEESAAADDAAQASSAPAPTMDPDVRALNSNIAELTMDLDANDRRHFYTLYNNNNLISTVKYVRDHIGDAIDACSENNPDMEEALRARYKEWTDAVNEKLGEAEGQVDNMVLAQEYASDGDLNEILKQADDLRAKTQENVERIPVTSPEACEYLLNKMDETQANMLRFLSAVLVAMPQAMDE
jgi:ABC-type transporter Mla subunit MlaD